MDLPQYYSQYFTSTILDGDLLKPDKIQRSSLKSSIISKRKKI